MARAKKVDIVEEPTEVIEEVATDVVEQEEVDETVADINEVTESVDEVATDVDEPTEKVDETVAEVKTTKKEIYVYIGPSLPNGALKSNTTLNGSLEEIKEHYKVELEKYPKMINFIVTTGQLGKYKKSMQDSKSFVSNLYKEIEKQIKQR